MTARATLSADARSVTLALRAWSEVFPVERLPARLRFYRALRDAPPPNDRARGYGHCFAPTVAALEKVEKVAKALGALR